MFLPTFDGKPNQHVRILDTFFARLVLHKLKPSPDTSRVTSSQEIPNDDRVTALARTTMSSDSKQLRSLLGGLRYYRRFLP